MLSSKGCKAVEVGTISPILSGVMIQAGYKQFTRKVFKIVQRLRVNLPQLQRSTIGRTWECLICLYYDQASGKESITILPDSILA